MSFTTFTTEIDMRAGDTSTSTSSFPLQPQFDKQNESHLWLSSIADEGEYVDMEYPFCESPTPVAPHFVKSSDIYTTIDPLKTDILSEYDDDDVADISMFDNNQQQLQQDGPIPYHISSKDAIKRICPSTLIHLFQGHYGFDLPNKTIVIDCRFPYEYIGGHIPGAINVDPSIDVNGIMFDSEFKPAISPDRIIIFHCEFSSERAPKMALELRKTDRLINASQYPYLHYPNVYILEGGYKAFFERNPTLCNPPNQYVPMRCVGKEDELKHHLGLGKVCDGTGSIDVNSFRNSQSSLSRKPSPLPMDAFLSSDINIDPSEYRQFSLAAETMFTSG